MAGDPAVWSWHSIAKKPPRLRLVARFTASLGNRRWRSSKELRRRRWGNGLEVLTDDQPDYERLLGQMVCDKHSLMDTANVRKIRITFRATVSPPPPEWLLKLATIHSYEDSVDPDVVADTPLATLVKDVSIAELLGVYCVFIQGHVLTVKDIIKYARDVAGGVHHDPTEQYGKYQIMGLFQSFAKIGGLPLGIRQLRAIGRVVIRGLEPLYQDIQAAAARDP